MKKIIFLLISLSFFVIEIRADSFRFVWEEGTTYVNVPLYANIQNYLNIPKAKLYRDNVLLEDAEISYLSNGDWLYLLSDVDTSKVGDYLVWFKATERKYQPGQCNGYKTLVTFHIEDLEAPKIIICPENIEHKIGSAKPDYLQMIEAVDNSGSCSVSLIDNVNYDAIGTYDVIVKVSDGYNVITKTIKVSVIDDVGPKITFLGENNKIIIPIGEELSLVSYFKAVDNIDGDVTNSIEYSNIDTDVEGEYEICVSFSDSLGNKSFIDISVIIVDNNIPEIVLYEQNIMLEYNIVFADYDFRSNILRAIDGKHDIIDDVIIDISELKNKVGVYSIYYSYQKKEQVVKVECKVHMLAYESPIINTQDIEIASGEIPNYEDFIVVEDPSDSNVASTIDIDDRNVDYSTPGVYIVYVTATNSSGLATTKSFYVTINESKSEFDWKIIVIIVMLGYLALDKILDIIKRRN